MLFTSFHCEFDLLPLTLKSNRHHLLILGNICAKFAQNILQEIAFVSIMFIEFLGHRSRRLRALLWSYVVQRPSSLVRKTLHFELLLQKDPGRGKNWSEGYSPLRIFFFWLDSHSNKPNAQKLSKSMWDEVLLFLVPFRSQIFDAF